MPRRRLWQVRLVRPAEADFRAILSWTEDKFGAAQALKYESLLRAALRRLANDPATPESRSRSDFGAGFHTLHITRPGRHLFVYRVVATEVIIVRILHDSMDIARHLPDVNEEAD